MSGKLVDMLVHYIRFIIICTTMQFHSFLSCIICRVLFVIAVACSVALIFVLFFVLGRS